MIVALLVGGGDHMHVEAVAKGKLTGAEFYRASWDWVQNLPTDAIAATAKWGDIGDWDVSSVPDFSWSFSTTRNMTGPFQLSYNIEGNPKAAAFTGGTSLSKWITSTVTSLGSMFKGASSMDADLSGWNVAKAISLEGTFYNAKNFAGTGLSSWITTSVTTLLNTFYGASSMDADVSGWIVSKVNSMAQTFTSTTSLSSCNKRLIADAWKSNDVFTTYVYDSIVRTCQGRCDIGYKCCENDGQRCVENGRSCGNPPETGYRTCSKGFYWCEMLGHRCIRNGLDTCPWESTAWVNETCPSCVSGMYFSTSVNAPAADTRPVSCPVRQAFCSSWCRTRGGQKAWVEPDKCACVSDHTCANGAATSSASVGACATCTAAATCTNGVKSACTNTTDTECHIACVAGSTWSAPNVFGCKPCAADSTCTSGVKKTCTTTTDTACHVACDAGKTFSSTGTAPCTTCAADSTCTHGVKSACTHTTDTVCNDDPSCEADTTWSITGNAPCVSCAANSTCGVVGVAKACTKTTNTMCREPAPVIAPPLPPLPPSSPTADNVCGDGMYMHRKKCTTTCPDGYYGDRGRTSAAEDGTLTRKEIL